MDESQIRKIGLDMIETHISWVLFSDEFVYKIKKPVSFSFLDFSTLEKRKFFCEEEVKLNRRLAPDVYIGVVPIDNELEIEGKQEPVGYAVKMKKLDNSMKMDRLLLEGKVNEEDVKKIAAVVAGFHEKIEVIREGYYTPEIVEKQITDLKNFREIVEEACGLGNHVDIVLQRSEKFIRENHELIRKRIADGMVRNCHGDLHSANIFIDGDPIIIDCIEFSRDFRYVDVASEIAFMAMDLDYHGRKDLADAFVDEYVKKTGDRELLKLLNLYKCYRANVRAKIAAIDYSQHPGEEPKNRIEKYMNLAESYSGYLSGL